MKISCKILNLYLFCFLLVSCNRPLPQLPSNKGNVVDKNAVSLLAINQNLAGKEDNLIRKFALQQDKAFKRNGIGFWYKIEQVGNGSKIKDSVNCKISYTLLSLKGEVLQNEIVKQIIIGKKQDTVGLEEGLKLLSKGDSATLIVPWYLAYGMKGNEPIVAPYTSVIYRVRVFN
jgi:FKBP-type peptidyl-prolyl cis-trans isomerase